MNNYIKLSDDTKIPLRLLPEMVPHDSFMGHTHIQVCEQFARLSNLPENLFGVYVNYLFTKSKRTKQLTSLIILKQLRKLTIKSVTSDFIDPTFTSLLGVEIHIEILQPCPTSLIDTRQFCVFFFKTLSHRIFRIFRRHKVQSKSIARAWVDTTDSVFPKEIDNLLLLVYPFSGNKFRQLRYIWLCIVEKRQYSLIGLNYKFIDIARILFNWKSRTELILLGEANAYQEHASDIVAMGVRDVFTTDEFEMAGYFLHEKLISKGCKCHNICHGMAVYGPYVTYTSMSFYSKYQNDFYSLRGVFDGANTLTFPTIKLGQIENSSVCEPVVVFVQGNWEQSQKKYEANFERQAISVIEKLCRNSGVPFMLKVHPNARCQWLKGLTSDSTVVTISSIECLKHKRPIFINIQSTAYYSFLQYGPTIFLEDDLLNPRRLFGEFIDSVSLENLHKTLKRYYNNEWWLERYQAQLISINDDKRQIRASPQPVGI